MKFIFRVNPLYVLLHALNASQKREPFWGWYRFANHIWERSPGLFYFMSGQPEASLYLKQNRLSPIAQQADRLLRKTMSTPQVQRLVKETENYRKSVESQMENNQHRASSIVQDLFGRKLPSKTVTVFLTHPNLNNGMTVDGNVIVWGHPEEYPNYSTVYIFHEAMHIITKHDDSPEMHAAIELLTDNELRIRLNGTGKYFDFPGHGELQQLERAMLCPVLRALYSDQHA